MGRKSDPNRIKPKPKGNLTLGDIIFWGIVILILAGGGGAVVNNSRSEDPCGKGCTPVPHSTITPEGVHDLPKKKDK